MNIVATDRNNYLFKQNAKQKDPSEGLTRFRTLSRENKSVEVQLLTGPRGWHLRVVTSLACVKGC